MNCYNQVIQLGSKYINAWNNKGIALGNLGKYEEAMNCYNQAIQLNSNISQAWNNKGIALGNLGKYEETINIYNQAIQLDPKYVNAWNNKGFALYNLGKYEEAVNCYNQAIQIVVNKHYVIVSFILFSPKVNFYNRLDNSLVADSLCYKRTKACENVDLSEIRRQKKLKKARYEIDDNTGQILERIDIHSKIGLGGANSFDINNLKEQDQIVDL